MPDVGDPVLTEEDGAEGGQQGEHAQRDEAEQRTKQAGSPQEKADALKLMVEDAHGKFEIS